MGEGFFCLSKEILQHLKSIKKSFFKGKIVSYIALKEDCFSIAHEFLLLIATFFQNVWGVKKMAYAEQSKEVFVLGAKIALKNHVVNDGFCQEKS